MPNIKQKAKGFVIGASVIPALGVLNHVAVYVSDWDNVAHHSLQHRFECAYTTNVPESHRHFIVSKGDYVSEETYPVGPGFTYPAMLIAGLAGAALSDERKRRKLQDIMQR